MARSPRKSVLGDDFFDDLPSSSRKSKGFGSSSLSDLGYGGYGGKGYKTTPRCYESHKPMPLPGTDLVIHGGSCSTPAVKDADVYIGFDYSMRFTQRHWPWKKGDEVFFEIRDMHAPASPEEFKKLIAWTKKQLEAGRKVHAGCIGGHGRTGTFLAALVAEYGEADAITYVRKHYCEKAVESSVQIKFLAEHFAIKPVNGSKEWSSTKTKKPKLGAVSTEPYQSGSAGHEYAPITGRGSIWG